MRRNCKMPSRRGRGTAGSDAGAIKAAIRPKRPADWCGSPRMSAASARRPGTRGALDTLRIAQGPKDSRAPRGSPKPKAAQTRAIIKILGRGALLLTAGAFNLALWIFGAVFALFGFLSSIKATTERLTLSWLQRSKAKRSAAAVRR